MTRSLLLAGLLLSATGNVARAQEVEAPHEPGLPAVSDGDDHADTRPSDADVEALATLLDEPVVTTPSRGAERASTAPSSVYTITADELRTFGIRTVDEALVFLGISMLTTRVRDYGSGGDVGANGLVLRDGGRHVLVLLDGQVMNSPDTGTVELHEGFGVPIEAIDHIEVMLGSGSVAYGSNAMLAVVHVITRRGDAGTGVHAVAELGTAAPTGVDGQPVLPEREGERAGLRYRLGLGFSHAFRLLGAEAVLTVRGEWLEEISSSFRTRAFTGDWIQLRPGQTSWGGVGHDGLIAPSGVASLRVGDFRLEIQASHYERAIPLVGTFDDPLAREVRSHVRIDLRHETRLDAHTTLVTRLYGGLNDWSETSVWTSPYWCAPGQIDGCIFSMRSRARWAGIEQQLTVDWNLDGNVVTSVGYDVRGRDATMRPAEGVDLVTGAPPATLRQPYTHSVSLLGAVFLQQLWRPVDWLLLNAGARLDVDGLFGAYLSPRLAATVQPLEGMSVRLSYSEAFRAPSAYELGEVDGTYRIRANGLGAEVSRTGELEWQQRMGWLSISLRGFIAFYEGFIQTRSATQDEARAAIDSGEVASTADPSLLVRWDNLGTLRSMGGSVALSLRPVEGLSIATSITVADTRRDDMPVPLVPPWSANARVAYAFARDGATLAAAVSFTSRRLAAADFETLRTYEVPEQAAFRATFTSPLPGAPGLSLRVLANYAVNPLTPALLDAPTPTAPDAAFALYPTTSTFFGSVGLSYDLSL